MLSQFLRNPKNLESKRKNLPTFPVPTKAMKVLKRAAIRYCMQDCTVRKTQIGYLPQATNDDLRRNLF